MDPSSQPSSTMQDASAAVAKTEPQDGRQPKIGYLATKKKIRVSDLQEAKRRGEKWAMLTSYDTISARVFDKAMIPCLLVGDSAAQMVYGYKSTLPVTMDELIPLARAVAAGCERSLVVVDLPFGSYQESPEVCLKNAIRFMKEAQVQAVKLEGGREYVKHVKLLTQSGIPVVAHVGFTPQSEHTIGGYKIQARGEQQAEQLVADALALQESGAFACVVEMVPSEVGQMLTQRLSIPVIGIGAGPNLDAQILVWHDMAGFTAPEASKATGAPQYLGEQSGSVTGGGEKFKLARAPKFVKRYASMSQILYDAAVNYAREVSEGSYPAREHCYE